MNEKMIFDFRSRPKKREMLFYDLLQVLDDNINLMIVKPNGDHSAGGTVADWKPLDGFDYHIVKSVKFDDLYKEFYIYLEEEKD